MPRSASAPRALIGTSGWLYRHWLGRFYPEGLPRNRTLPFFAERFPTVEINGAFYRMPTITAVEAWAAATPARFVFAWKASRFLTHIKRLRDVDDYSLDLMESRLTVLGEKLGPVLFQLPQRMAVDRERLAAFLPRLNPERRYVFEFRDPSWYVEPVFDLLREHGMALCLSDHADAPAPWVETADLVYVRAHGSTGRYRGHYDLATLGEWARRIRGWHAEGRQVCVYFNNDEGGAATVDASRLIDMLGPEVAEQPALATSPRVLEPAPGATLKPSLRQPGADPSHPAR